MTEKISAAIGRLIVSILIVYFAAVYVPRAFHDPTTWNIFWGFFWFDNLITSGVSGGIRAAKGP
jgi:hypothetical protein